MDTQLSFAQHGRMTGLGLPSETNHYTRLLAALRRAVQRRASDVHLVVGLPPMFRIDGELIADTDASLGRDDVRELIYSLLSEAQQEEFTRDWQLCVSIFIPELGHFRVTVYSHMGNAEASIRVCPLSLRTPQELGLPEIVHKLIEKRSGLILITGPTGSGKTTTFNCMIDMINRQRRCKIITVEDPVEFVHENRLSLIVQQQVHSDTRSFSKAMVHILRQDPDVIGVGEMRDLETISMALTAAETGHLVIATLHTPDAAQTVDRIVDVFPGDMQAQIQTQLASCLVAVIAQQLVPRVDADGRKLATEVLIGTGAVRSQIRERKSNMLRSTMQTGRKEGMQLMERSLLDLYQSGVITYDSAIAHSHSPDVIQQLMAPDKK
ncbi:MAG: PilT/PilU family type 4a pilus ATPase [Capsulimonas sp.]|uniref:type IV pilus twitching motility protein PilT n=1 Tax=Capsulimonas sp. TaxID=2494211 RepID=UPI0032663E03